MIDLLGERPLPALEEGDLLAVLDVGGYAEVLSNQFNLLPRPATVLVDGDSCEVIRRRETMDDILAHAGRARQACTRLLTIRL